MFLYANDKFLPVNITKGMSYLPFRLLEVYNSEFLEGGWQI